jgi:hypothetical protein
MAKLVSLIYIAKQLHIIPQTLWHFVVFNHIPIHQRKPKLVLDLDANHPFLQATKDALHWQLPIFYTVPQLAKLWNKDAKTTKKYLQNYDIPIQNQEKRGFVYLTDFLLFIEKQDNLSEQFLNHLRSKSREKHPEERRNDQK